MLGVNHCQEIWFNFFRQKGKVRRTCSFWNKSSENLSVSLNKKSARKNTYYCWFYCYWTLGFDYLLFHIFHKWHFEVVIKVCRIFIVICNWLRIPRSLPQPLPRVCVVRISVVRVGSLLPWSTAPRGRCASCKVLPCCYLRRHNLLYLSVSIVLAMTKTPITFLSRCKTESRSHWYFLFVKMYPSRTTTRFL